MIIPMFPKMTPFSVDETLTVALMLQKSCGAKTTGWGRSTNFRSPNVASSRMQFCSVSSVNFQMERFKSDTIKINLNSTYSFG